MAAFAISVLKAIAWINLVAGVLIGFVAFNASQQVVRTTSPIEYDYERITNPLYIVVGLASILGGISVWAFFITVAYIADNVGPKQLNIVTETEADSPVRYVPIPDNPRYRPTRPIEQ